MLTFDGMLASFVTVLFVMLLALTLVFCVCSESAIMNGLGELGVSDSSATLEDGDKGDITVSGSGTTWNIDANTITSTELSDEAVTPAKLADGDYGAMIVVDGVISVDPNIDLEINSVQTEPSEHPGMITYDSDGEGATDDDKKTSEFGGELIDTTEDAEYGRAEIGAMVNGTMTDGLHVDGSSLTVYTLSGWTLAAGVGSRTLTNCEGTHDGDNNAAIMTDSGESLTVDGYIGMTLYNITDSSSCTITDNDGTTITCTLAGGTDNDWDTNDEWAVAPGPYQSGFVWYITSATTILHPATAYYVAGYFAGAAQIIKVNPQSDSMTINFSDDGVYTDPGAGDEIDGDGTQGDFLCIHNASATEAYSWGVNGSWADGGSS